MAIPVLILVGFAIASKADHDWARVASVNGVAIDRAHLRDEMVFQDFLLAEEVDAIRIAAVSGKLDANAAATERAALESAASDPVENARTALVDDELIRQLAVREGVTVSEPDTFSELATYLSSTYGRHIRFVTIAPRTGPAAAMGAPDPAQPALTTYPIGSLSMAGARASSDLAAGASLASVVAALRSAGYEAAAGDRSIGPTGAVSGVDPSLLASVRALDAPGAISPFVDRRGAVVAAALIGISATDPGYATRLEETAASSHVNASTIADWARPE